MGYARISTTAIYADACGPEEVGFARNFWSTKSLKYLVFSAGSKRGSTERCRSTNLGEGNHGFGLRASAKGSRSELAKPTRDQER